MNKEMIFTAKSVDEALMEAAAMLDKEVSSLNYEVVDEAKKGFFGVGSQDAKIKVFVEVSAGESAKEFLVTVLGDMGLENTSVTVSETEKNTFLLDIKGDNLGIIIGRHGEILDSLQYLTNLAVNKTSDKYMRIYLDIENYREKREEALRSLARKMAARVKKIGRNIPFEPMNPYERRIIHSEVQNIDGVTTFSIGNGDERKVIMAYDGPKKPKHSASANESKKSDEGYKPTPKYNFVSTPKPAKPAVKPAPIQKVKSIDDLNLADPDEGISFNE